MRSLRTDQCLPLTRAMCAPVGDGAAAAILCSEKYLKRFKEKRPVRIRASVLGSGMHRDIEGTDIGERLSKQAYDMAGLGPKDIHLAELHDATSYGELHQTEAMGFCKLGEGGIFAESGATTLGGRLPINTSGGLECRGHPIGASVLPRSMRSSPSCGARRANARWKGRASGSPRTAEAIWAWKKPP